jgi:hypothetical protein
MKGGNVNRGDEMENDVCQWQNLMETSLTQTEQRRTEPGSTGYAGKDTVLMSLSHLPPHIYQSSKVSHIMEMILICWVFAQNMPRG